jgi:hypothetical protein
MEGFAIEHVISVFETRDAYFWATHAGAELDLLLMTRGRRYGFEFKYAGAQEYALHEKISVIPMKTVAELLEKLQ